MRTAALVGFGWVLGLFCPVPVSAAVTPGNFLLASSDGAHITGEIIRIDGGTHA